MGIDDSILKRINFEELINELKERGAKRVGVQLPDGLKFKSHEIIKRVEDDGFQVILSGSGSYGACDIDTSLLNEVDILIHFGHTAILKIGRVIYTPYFIDFEIKIEDIKIEEKRIALIATAQYAWKLNEVKRILEDDGYDVELNRGKRVKFPGQVLGCNYSVLRNSSADAVLFIGDGLFHPVGASIYSKKKVYRYSPLSREFGEVTVEDFLRKRMNLLAKAMYSEKKGAIIVSSKPGQKRFKLAERLQREGRDAGKEVDLLMVDEITPSKLLNFPYGYYVNTACPRISYDDAELFSSPILTPQEFEIMTGKRDWNNYSMDEIF
jgi:2-(3-amino-3-carboxypropyl)histidine synthase